MRACLFGFALLLAVAALPGCHQPEDAGRTATLATPAAPSFVSLPPTWITVYGRTSLGAPGESTQLRASGTFLDGTRQDLTDQVGWSSCGLGSSDGSCPGCPYKVVSVDATTGMVQAVAYGRTNIVAIYPRGSTCGTPGSVRGWTPFRVVPDGMAVMSGRVTVGGAGHGGVFVELETGSVTLRAVSNAAGAFMFAPVAGEVRLHAWHEGFSEVRRTLRVTSDEDIDLELTPELASSLFPPR
jgi:hypothetical protein